MSNNNNNNCNFHILPLSSIGLKMDSATVRIAVGLRLGAPIVRPHKCVCGTEVAVHGHVPSCRHGSAQDDIHAPIKSTRYCVGHLTLPEHMQFESHTRSVVAMSRDQMEQLRFRGRGPLFHGIWVAPFGLLSLSNERVVGLGRYPFFGRCSSTVQWTTVAQMFSIIIVTM